MAVPGHPQPKNAPPLGSGHDQDAGRAEVVNVGREGMTEAKADVIAKEVASGLRRALRKKRKAKD